MGKRLWNFCLLSFYFFTYDAIKRSIEKITLLQNMMDWRIIIPVKIEINDDASAVGIA